MDTGIYDAVLYPLTTSVPSRKAAHVAGDYLSLTKPRAVALHLFTATVSMFLAARGLPPVKILALVLVGGGLAAGASNALNCYFDRDLDARMERTKNRPLPAGRLSPLHALLFGLFCGTAGLGLLLLVNITVAALALAALSSYALAYTLWLKRKGGAGTVLSSGIGAMPPLIGWLAVTGHISAVPFLLFGIIALWTPPHFWSLALWKGDEYRGAGLSALPGNKTALWITAFVLPLVAVSLALVRAAQPDFAYAAAAIILGTGYVLLCLHLIARPGATSARLLYVYSILYLVILFAAMMLRR